MKINELLTNIKNKEFNLERDLQVKKYLPMEVKKTIAKGIIYDCTNEEDGVIKVDSVQRYLSYVKYMITMHTNFAYTDEDYDALCSTQYGETCLLNAILDCFKDDAKECVRILNFMMDDYLRDFSMESSVARFLNNLSNTISDLSEKINSKFKDIDVNSMIPEGLDTDKLNDFLNTYMK